jgi:hypothetical protein
VLYWAVLAARGLAGFMARHAERGGSLSLAEADQRSLVTGAILAVDPLLNNAAPTTLSEFANLLRRLADTLGQALPKP